MGIFDKMMKAPFMLIKAPFKHLNTDNNHKGRPKLTGLHWYILGFCFFALFEMSMGLFSNPQLRLWAFFPFYLFDGLFFIILLYIFLPFVFQKSLKPWVRIGSAAAAVLSFSVILHFYEAFLRYLKNGIFETNWTFKSFHYSEARGTLITLITYLLYNNRYVRFVEREIAYRQSHELELKNDLLRAQIDPHLINNVLFVLYSRIQQYSKEDAEIINHLSGLTSHSISQSNEKGLISLATEVHNIKNYIRIMELCKEHSINVNWDINLESNKDIILPPNILLEPIVNAMKYGQFSKETPIEIHLRIINNMELVFRTYNHKAVVTNQSSHSIGMQNLRERLHLYFPGMHELQIINTETTYELNLKLML